MGRGLRGVCDLLVDAEATADLLHDAICGADVIDWDMFSPELAEGARHALTVGQLSMAKEILGNIRAAMEILHEIREPEGQLLRGTN